ncbi:RNA polymerase subunit sigma-70 [Actinopolyspora erythraea]|uniref:RNA polymerase subunit sigma-70 n=1 Tax=Actinopolyspora erythraea TaxID=414996 RepID=A0A099D182_9ACTN|nr:sigma-70 family RNA polymerase sigma factor [Actinopolyspora erythraea]ASU77952.1 RNA polymerase subunit sigma-70 [Actinopolyspora erythraea]KGI79711.1 RNA polymerase subunit sigma-70 [Actinopolyspora erythraea]
MTADSRPDEGLWRELTRQALARLVRTCGSARFDLCEDAVQEALLHAYQRWPTQFPDDPLGWLTATARRRYADHARSDARRRHRETRAVSSHPPVSPEAAQRDDSLLVLQLCCHPELPRSGQVALTLRAVAGLTTAQIANVYQVPESTIAQRITRAKRRVSELGRPLPSPEHAEERVTAVLDVLYVMFTEAHHTTTGAPPRDADLAAEAIHLTRLLRGSLPESTEVAGLLALMLLSESRHPSRIGPDGDLKPFDEQDRTLWDRELIDEGTKLVERVTPAAEPGPYLLQACIAALHAEALDIATTDWDEILALYRVLELVTGHGNPTITLNRIVAQAMVDGNDTALAQIDVLEADHPRLPRINAVRAHLLEQANRPEDAASAYRRAIAATVNLAEQQHLRNRLRGLSGVNE